MDNKTRETLGVNENKPNDWFETLYAHSNESGEGVPWANMDVHPVLKSWLTTNTLKGKNQTALVVGCGLGDDAIQLESLGFSVTAFDVAESAVQLCKKRFPNSKVDFVQADLIAGVPEWKEKFDFVLEIFTIQALPPKYENGLIKNLADFVSSNGKLLVITEIQNATRTYEVGPPWLLNQDYIQKFEAEGLTKTFLQDDTTPEIGDACHLAIFEKQTNSK